MAKTEAVGTFQVVGREVRCGCLAELLCLFGPTAAVPVVVQKTQYTDSAGRLIGGCWYGYRAASHEEALDLVYGR